MVSVLATIAVVIRLIAPLFFSFPFPEKAVCHPLSFPKGDTLKLNSYEVRRFSTTAAFSAVDLFYSQVLVAKADEEQNDQEKSEERNGWVQDHLAEGEAIFSCRHHLNPYEIEWGCVYLAERVGGTELILTWYVTPTDAPSCVNLPGLIR
jgi:hypothetical protein